jgi:hypothetical protein
MCPILLTLWTAHTKRSLARNQQHLFLLHWFLKISASAAFRLHMHFGMRHAFEMFDAENVRVESYLAKHTRHKCHASDGLVNAHCRTLIAIENKKEQTSTWSKRSPTFTSIIYTYTNVRTHTNTLTCDCNATQCSASTQLQKLFVYIHTHIHTVRAKNYGRGCAANTHDYSRAHVRDCALA